MNSRDTKNAPTRASLVLRSIGGLLLVVFVVFPFALGVIRPATITPELGYVVRFKSWPSFVYVSQSDIVLHRYILMAALIVLVIDLIYELVVIPLMRRRK